ncbi:MAG: radical SAM family heme chaperone HemW [Candidatus Acidiferrales bacterium]|jgi:oxygen-independent coproporphyrinogen-3 oxidase
MPHGLYIQVPFCQAKCTYCNFHTGVFSSGLQSPYVSAVCREMEMFREWSARAGIPWRADDDEPVCVDTLYVGGGTPSMLDAAELARLLAAARAAFPSNWTESTLEADPETVTPDRAAVWLVAGVNRISMGVQSFNDRELAPAGRQHRRADIYTATKRLRDAGFANIGFDLIAGLPHQTEASWSDSLSRLIDLRPEHVSIYLLEVDDGSRLGKEILSGGARYSAAAVPSEDAMADSYDLACARLESAGYDHYEISNWALPGLRSRHNLKYWRREPYLGFGAGAHSFSNAHRWADAHDPNAYIAAITEGKLPFEQLEHVSQAQADEEELFLGLRQLDGIDLAQMPASRRAEIDPRIEALRDQGLVELEGTRLRLAKSKLTVSNEVFVSLLD